MRVDAKLNRVHTIQTDLGAVRVFIEMELGKDWAQVHKVSLANELTRNRLGDSCSFFLGSMKDTDLQAFSTQELLDELGRRVTGG